MHFFGAISMPELARERTNMSNEGFPIPNGIDPAAAPEAPSPELTRWQKFRLVVKVVELRLRFVALMAATGLVFAYWDTLWNYYDKYTRPQGEQLVAASEFEFFCPMHPSFARDTPGNCPICGMPLSKRKKGQSQELPEGVTARVQLSPMRVAQAGVRTVAVGYEPLAQTVTTVGLVEHDERRVARISSKIKGLSRVEKLYVNFTGTTVKAGDVLAEVYSPDLYQAVRELLLAQQRSREAPPVSSPLSRSLWGGGEDLVRLATEKLELWGITQEQIDAILKSGKAVYKMPILAPISGHVTQKTVFEGQYVAEGETMFVVADLGQVWVQAKVYEDQLPLIRVGQEGEASVEALPGEVFPGRVAFIFPHLDPATRTVDVRFDLPNPDHQLRPGMYATVTLKTPLEVAPQIRTRLASAHTPANHSGHPGSMTVEQQRICPVTKAKLGSMGEPVPVQLASRKVWVCCPGCPDKLRGEPDKYLARLEPQPAQGVLSVPESAVIDTGDRKIVYVESEPGVFEGRQVVLGTRIGDRFPVLEGLSKGDKVAASGSFLIDAETRLNQGATATSETATRTPDKPTPSATSSGGVHRH
jgi:Cu(I)/Ag(I) efflux system membrane fusion protein